MILNFVDVMLMFDQRLFQSRLQFHCFFIFIEEEENSKTINRSQYWQEQRQQQYDNAAVVVCDANATDCGSQT